MNSSFEHKIQHRSPKELKEELLGSEPEVFRHVQGEPSELEHFY